MAQAGVTIAGVCVAAYLAYLFASQSWRRQQRREVYGQFLAATETCMNVLVEGLAEPVSDLDVPAIEALDRLEFPSAIAAVSATWAQLRLVAPRRVERSAAVIAHGLQFFDMDGRHALWSVAKAMDEHAARPGVSWPYMHRFIDLARQDLRVESRIQRWWHDENEGSRVWVLLHRWFGRPGDDAAGT